MLRTDLDLVLKVYELLVEQEGQLRTELIRLARREEPVRRFEELPGFGWIRSLTFYVYIDTPSRRRLLRAVRGGAIFAVGVGRNCEAWMAV